MLTTKKSSASLLNSLTSSGREKSNQHTSSLDAIKQRRVKMNKNFLVMSPLPETDLTQTSSRAHPVRLWGKRKKKTNTDNRPDCERKWRKTCSWWMSTMDSFIDFFVLFPLHSLNSPYSMSNAFIHRDVPSTNDTPVCVDHWHHAWEDRSSS